jgi:hypothetical protein
MLQKKFHEALKESETQSLSTEKIFERISEKKEFLSK